jgi:hypothetical protein
MTHNCGVGGGGGGDVVGLGLGLGLGDEDGLVDGLELVDGLADGLGLVSVALGDGVLVSAGVLVVLGVVVSVGVLVALGVAVALGEVVSVGEVVALGEVVSLGVPGIRAAVRTTDDAGGVPQAAVAAFAAPTANPVKIMPVPKNAMPMITPSAPGFSSSALTGCNLASVSRPRTTLVASLRHSTHGLGSGSRYRGSDTKGS